MKHQRHAPWAAWTLAPILIALLAEPSAAAPTAGWSWNLSRDRLTNVSGPWSSLVSPTPSPFLWQPLQLASSACFNYPGLPCMYESDNAMVGHAAYTGALGNLAVVNGVPLVHPGWQRVVAVRWTNPIGQSLDLRILGRITDLDPNGLLNGHDGIHFYVARGVVTLTQGAVSSGPAGLDSRSFFAVTTVAPGEAVYFIVDGGTTNTYDLTELDVLITGTLHCTLPDCSTE